VLRGEEKFSSMEIINKYKLGTSSNVNRIKQALIHKEIIEIQVERIEFIDPLYRDWLKKYYYKIV
jgi:hypothetical protein